MAAAMVVPVIIGGVALADTSKTVIYEVSETNIRPTAMTEEELRILFHKLIASTKQEPGLIQINVTQEVGQPYNYILIEQRKNQTALDEAAASAAT